MEHAHRVRDRRRRRRRRVALTLLGLLLAGAIAAAIWHEWVTAQVRAAVVLAEVLDSPSSRSVTHALTHTPREREVELAGAPTSVYEPGGSGHGPWPAVVFLTGADTRGRHNPELERLARGLARAGFITYVPDISDLRSGSLGETTYDSAVAVVRSAAQQPRVRHHRVALASACAGTSLALVLAADPALRGQVSAVGGVAPYADLRDVVMIATTGHYRDAHGSLHAYPVEPRMREILVRSLYAGLRTAGAPPRVVDALEQRSFADGQDDPTAPLRAMNPQLLRADSAVGSTVRLLANQDPERFDALWARLPPSILRWASRLSPLEGAADIDMPVELATSPHDKYFPPDQARRLVAALPHANLVVTASLDHANPHPGDAGGLAHLDGFIVRFLRDASRGD